MTRVRAMEAVCCILMGGLGNQLFMIAAAYGHARNNNCRFVIVNELVHHSVHSTEAYENTVFKNFQKDNIDHMVKHTTLFEEPPNAVVGVLLSLPQPVGSDTHLLIKGYFQDQRYLPANYIDDFIKLLNLPDVICADNESKPHTCFIHVRRTDYLLPGFRDVHYVDLAYYYSEAIRIVKDKNPRVQFMVFSDDIDWCKKNKLFIEEGAQFCEDPNEVRNLVMMSQCQYGGICANSPFSWWGAFLNRNPKKVVLFPKQWFANGTENMNNPAPEGSILVDTYPIP